MPTTVCTCLYRRVLLEHTAQSSVEDAAAALALPLHLRQAA